MRHCRSTDRRKEGRRVRETYIIYKRSARERYEQKEKERERERKREGYTTREREDPINGGGNTHEEIERESAKAKEVERKQERLRKQREQGGETRKLKRPVGLRTKVRSEELV